MTVSIVYVCRDCQAFTADADAAFVHAITTRHEVVLVPIDRRVAGQMSHPNRVA